MKRRKIQQGLLRLVLLWASLLMSHGRLAVGEVKRTFVIIQTMKPFSSILYDSTVFASCRILPSIDRAISAMKIKSHPHRPITLHKHTGVNMFLLADFPPLFFRDLFFDLPDLLPMPKLSSKLQT